MDREHPDHEEEIIDEEEIDDEEELEDEGGFEDEEDDLSSEDSSEEDHSDLENCLPDSEVPPDGHDTAAKVQVCAETIHKDLQQHEDADQFSGDDEVKSKRPLMARNVKEEIIKEKIELNSHKTLNEKPLPNVDTKLSSGQAEQNIHGRKQDQSANELDYREGEQALNVREEMIARKEQALIVREEMIYQMVLDLNGPIDWVKNLQHIEDAEQFPEENKLMNEQLSGDGINDQQQADDVVQLSGEENSELNEKLRDMFSKMTLEQKENTMFQLQEKLLKEHTRLKGVAQRYRMRDEEMKKKEEALQMHYEDLNGREKQILDKEKNLEKKEKWIDGEERDLARRKALFERKEKGILEKERNIKEREDNNKFREEFNNKELASLNRRDEEIKELQKQLRLEIAAQQSIASNSLTPTPAVGLSSERFHWSFIQLSADQKPTCVVLSYLPNRMLVEAATFQEFSNRIRNWIYMRKGLGPEVANQLLKVSIPTKSLEEKKRDPTKNELQVFIYLGSLQAAQMICEILNGSNETFISSVADPLDFKPKVSLSLKDERPLPPDGRHGSEFTVSVSKI